MKLIKLSDDVLSKLNYGRLKEHRARVLAYINKKEKDGHWCCEYHCEWVKDPNHTYPDKNADYLYRDKVNLYYNAATYHKAKGYLSCSVK